MKSVLSLLLIAGCGGDGAGDSGGTEVIEGDFRVEIAPGANSVLIAEVSVTTDAEAVVWVEYQGDEVAAMVTPESDSGVDHELVVLGMRAESEYDFDVYARYDDGSEEIVSATFTTGELPSSVAEFSVDNIDGREEGYTYFGPAVVDMYSVAIDPDGNVVWYYEEPGVTPREADRELTPLGNSELLVLKQGEVRVIDTSGEELVTHDSSKRGGRAIHHDLIPMPGGGYLGLAAEDREMEIAGRGTKTVRGDWILELDENGEVVWEWLAFDHLDTTRFPGALSKGNTIDGRSIDWSHANGIQYIEEDDSIILSVRNQSQIVKIDHATGEVIWILGEDGDFELGGGEWFYNQHAPELLDDGRILIYDNGNERPDDPESYSRAVLFELDEENMVATQTWEFVVETYTGRLGDVDLLDNGNVLVCGGGVDHGQTAMLYEVPLEQGADPVWTLSIPGEILYRATRVDTLY